MLENYLSESNDPEAQAIIDNSVLVKEPNRYSFKTSQATNKDILSSDLSTILKDMEMNRVIKINSLGFLNKIQATKLFPTKDEEFQQLVTNLHQEHERNLKRQLSSVRDLVDIFEAKDGACIYYRIITYFNPDDTLPGKRCGKCSVCVTRAGVGVELWAHYWRLSPEKFNNKYIDEKFKFKNIYEKVAPKLIPWGDPYIDPADVDPEFLAKFAKGVQSPRMRRLGIAGLRIFYFGTMRDWNYEVSLVKRLSTLKAC